MAPDATQRPIVFLHEVWGKVGYKGNFIHDTAAWLSSSAVGIDCS